MGTDGRTDVEIDRRTDIANLIVTFRNFVSALKRHIAIKRFWVCTCFNFHVDFLDESNV
jgi:hypothetical protein